MGPVLNEVCISPVQHVIPQALTKWQYYCTWYCTGNENMLMYCVVTTATRQHMHELLLELYNLYFQKRAMGSLK